MPKIKTFPSEENIPAFAEVADRVEFIADLMEGMCWKRGKSAKVLAKVWGLSKSAVENYSAEASRRVEADASSLRRLAGVQGEELMTAAYLAGKAKDWATIVKQLADISGANAPIKQDINVTDDASPTRARELLGTAFRGDVGKRGQESENATEPESEPSEVMITDMDSDNELA